MKELDLNLIKHFKVLYEEQSVSNAAAKAHISQSTMSHIVNRLRKYFDDPLFIRSSTGVVPTGKATLIFEKVLPAFMAFTNEVENIDAFDPVKSTKTFTIALNDFMQMYILSDLFNNLKKEAPGVTLNILPLKKAQLSELSNGNIDVIVGTLIEPVYPFIGNKYITEELTFLVREGHPVFSEDKVTPKLISSYKHLIVSKSEGCSWNSIHALRDLGYNPETGLETPVFLTVPYLLMNTDLVYTASKREAGFFIPRFPLKMVESPFKIAQPVFNIVWHERTTYDPANIWFRQILHNIAQNI
ncbi:MAG: LysR family transcriptional regulator [bacterium]|nr:LysR family transcriptional regulator [bacterium]